MAAPEGFWCARRPLYTEVKAISREMRINGEIRAREVRLVGEGGEQLGIVGLRDALRIATEQSLDLVEVAPTARPPVVRVMDFGKFKYEQSKRDREARKKQHNVVIKEVKMRPRIETHDFDVKLKNAERFLREGDKVKATIMFRGREIVHTDIGREVLERLAASLEELAQVERPARVEGRNLTMILTPREHAQAH
jgi:translation initiation factor IF-3